MQGDGPPRNVAMHTLSYFYIQQSLLIFQTHRLQKLLILNKNENFVSSEFMGLHVCKYISAATAVTLLNCLLCIFFVS